MRTDTLRKTLHCLAGLLAGLATTSLRSAEKASDSAAGAAPNYLELVRAYADTMIAHGRDDYGPQKSPLFAATLNRQTLRIPDKPPGGIPGVRVQDRTLWGANPMHDQNLYQVLYGLSEVTGVPKYAAEADKALKWFFENCQSPVTGLMAWGEHIGWDFRREGVEEGHTIHEFFRPWVLWKKTFELAPKPAQRFALGVWNHQISNQQTGVFSRHAAYARHAPGKGHEFPRHGGFYMATWAEAYQFTRDPEMLRAIETLLGYFDRSANKHTGAIPSQGAIPDLFWPMSALGYAIDLGNSAPLVPAALGDAMRRSAAKVDSVFLRMKHDLSPGGKGFIKNAHSSTLEAGDVRVQLMKTTKPAWYPYTYTWLSAYGMPTDANLAMFCLLRYDQTRNDGYKQLIVASARRYLDSLPDTSIALYPTAMAEAIANLLAAYRLTGDKAFNDRAEVLGRESVRIFFDGSPLPRASSQHTHYEAITGGDTLVMQLLDLWAAQNTAAKKPRLVWTNR